MLLSWDPSGSDKADIDLLEQYDDLWEIMVHETTHVLGFGPAGCS